MRAHVLDISWPCSEELRCCGHSFSFFRDPIWSILGGEGEIDLLFFGRTILSRGWVLAGVYIRGMVAVMYL